MPEMTTMTSVMDNDIYYLIKFKVIGNVITGLLQSYELRHYVYNSQKGIKYIACGPRGVE